jgi:error-prone DNA polymerase
VVDKIVSERAGGRFQSFHDFWTRVHPDHAQARILIRAGCFDTVAGELTRPALLWRLHAYREGYPLSLPVPEEYSPGQQLQHEIETFGFPLRQHPLESYRSELQQLECVAAANMSHYIGKEVTMVGWLVSEKLVQTKHGEPMEFVTFEDLTGLYDATLFPDIYRNVCQSLTPDRAYVLRGRIEEDFGAVTFMVVQLECLQHPVYSPAKERTKPLLPRVML